MPHATPAPTIPSSRPQHLAALVAVGLAAVLLALPAAASLAPYTTAFGGSDLDLVNATKVTAGGDYYLVGETLSTDFPTTHPPIGNPEPGGYNAFVVRLNATGTEVLYSVLVGGTGDDFAKGLALDADGYLYLVGATTSADFPVTAGAADTQCGSDGQCNWGYLDAFAMKLDPAASQLVYSTFLGGNDRDVAYHLVLDGFRRALIVGATASPDFPVAEAFQPTLNPGAPYGIPWDGFVTRLSANGTKFQVSTFLGGGGEEAVYDARLTGAGLLALAGTTGSLDFPTSVQAFQPGYGGGASDGFLTVLSASLRRIEGSTYLGGAKLDEAVAVAVNAQDNLFVAGRTKSSNFPVVQALKEKLAGTSDAFVTGFAAAGLVATRLFSTYYGGSDAETAVDVEIDAAQRVVLAGTTYSASLPGVPQNLSPGAADTFVTTFAANGLTAQGAALATEFDDVVSDVELNADGTVSIGGSLLPPAGPEGAGDGSTDSTMLPGDSFAARLPAQPAN